MSDLISRRAKIWINVRHVANCGSQNDRKTHFWIGVVTVNYCQHAEYVVIKINVTRCLKLNISKYGGRGKEPFVKIVVLLGQCGH